MKTIEYQQRELFNLLIRLHRQTMQAQILVKEIKTLIIDMDEIDKQALNHFDYKIKISDINVKDTDTAEDQSDFLLLSNN